MAKMMLSIKRDVQRKDVYPKTTEEYQRDFYRSKWLEVIRSFMDNTWTQVLSVIQPKMFYFLATYYVTYVK